MQPVTEAYDRPDAHKAAKNADRDVERPDWPLSIALLNRTSIGHAYTPIAAISLSSD